jgi:streptogramin lyase
MVRVPRLSYFRIRNFPRPGQTGTTMPCSEAFVFSPGNHSVSRSYIHCAKRPLPIPAPRKARPTRTSAFTVAAPLLLLGMAALAASGCGAGKSPLLSGVSPTSNSVPGVALRGRVHGGQQPISGAQVYLYEVGAGGYGGASKSLLNGPGYVTTGSDGSFSITGDYSCTGVGIPVYLYAVGGSIGAVSNSSAGLLAGLGPCEDLSSSTFVEMNEVSTVATAYAIAGFATDATHVSNSGSTLANRGALNAFSTIENLETLSTGTAPATTPAGNGTVPQAEIDTLANILAACINSTGPGSTACSTLFSNAMNGTTAPTDTATAAINIAHNPGANIANLYALQTASSPFQPMLSSAPNDFTLSVTYTGGGLNTPEGIAIDANGNVWAANSGNDSISEFNPLGGSVSGSSGFTGGGLNQPVGIAVDANGSVWVTNYGGNGVSEFSSNGTPNANSPFIGGGLNNPFGIVIDGAGNLWVTNYSGNSISEFSSSTGAASGNSPITGGGLNSPGNLAVDTSGNVWVGNTAAVLSEFNSSGSSLAGSSGFSNSEVGYASGVGVDASGNVWVTNYQDSRLVEYEPGTGFLSGSNGYAGGGLYVPNSLAIDGSSNIWIPNTYNSSTSVQGSITEFNSSGSPVTGSNGYVSSGTNDMDADAIDLSGDLWVTNGQGNSITEFVGIATPVVTPVVANLMSPYGSHAVNKP